jgi:hypothetical protein
MDFAKRTDRGLEAETDAEGKSRDRIANAGFGARRPHAVRARPYSFT